MHGREAATSKHSGKDGEKVGIKREDRLSEMRRECLLFLSKKTKEHQRAHRNVFYVLLAGEEGSGKQYISIKSFVKS